MSLVDFCGNRYCGHGPRNQTGAAPAAYESFVVSSRSKKRGKLQPDLLTAQSIRPKCHVRGGAYRRTGTSLLSTESQQSQRILMSRRNSRTPAAPTNQADRPTPTGDGSVLVVEQLMQAINDSMDERFLKVEAVLTELAQGMIALSQAPALQVAPSAAGYELADSEKHSNEYGEHDQRSYGAASDSPDFLTRDRYEEAVVTELRAQIEAELRGELSCLEERIRSLQDQNTELASQLAQASIRKSLNLTAENDPTLTWEQRKAIMFASDAPDSSDASSADPELSSQIAQLQAELQIRNEEVQQLQALLEQRPQQIEEGTALGAASLAMMLDSDELIREERQRLQELQAEWEAKFREVEIAASIERANLARQRMQLEKQNAELEEQLTHLKRELRQEEQAGPNQKRRWLAKLGLAE